MTIRESLIIAAIQPHRHGKENKKATNAQNICGYFGITVKEAMDYKKGKTHETIRNK